MTKKSNTIKNKLINACKWSGAAIIFLGGMFASYKKIDSQIDEINKSNENIVLHNTKENFNNYNLKDTAYLIADYYLYNSKNIKITTLDNGSDFNVSGGLLRNETTNYNSLIKEISIYRDGDFVPVEPSSRAHEMVLNLRGNLAESLINETLFNDPFQSQELVKFRSFIVDNLDNTPVEWQSKNTSVVLLTSIMYAILASGYFIGSNFLLSEEKEY